jgi:hypothetical protein
MFLAWEKWICKGSFISDGYNAGWCLHERMQIVMRSLTLQRIPVPPLTYDHLEVVCASLYLS